MIDTIIADYARFTANSALPRLVWSINSIVAKNTAGLSKFQAGDNLNILSAGIIVPPPFPLVRQLDTGINQYSAGMVAKLSYITVPHESISFDTHIPFSPYELAIGQYEDVNNDSDYEVHLNLGAGAYYLLSALAGVPASYDGQIFSVGLFVKVQHTLPMVA